MSTIDTAQLQPILAEAQDLVAKLQALIVAPVTTMPPPAGYSSNQMIFDDNFAKLDPAKWQTWLGDKTYGRWSDRGVLLAPYSGPNAGGYNAEYYDPAQLAYGSSGLVMTAKRSTKFSGFSWVSGCICTEGLFSFSGGFVQVRMKQPDTSTGAWPAVWFMDSSYQMNIQEGGFDNGVIPPNRAFSSTINSPSNVSHTVDVGVDLSADFHVYGMEWRPGQSFKSYFDGKLIQTLTMEVPAGAAEILINLQMAQGAQGWHTDISSATPDGLQFQISELQVYHL